MKIILLVLLPWFAPAAMHAAAPVISSSGTSTGQVGVAYSYQITASNTPTSFSATGLPTGLSINSSGLISGTPTAAATSTITLGATNASGTGNKTLTLTVNPPTPVINSTLTATGQKGVAFTYTITATNSPTSYAATGLPTGLSVSSTTGAITGTPTTAATTNVSIKATNAGGTGSATLVLTVNPATPVISSAATATGQLTNAFSYQIAASNTPTSFSASGLPAGLSVDTGTGLISGTPTALGNSTVTLGATNAGGTGNKTLTITINPATPVITSAATGTGQVGVAFSYQITATNSPTSYAATGLPTGLSVSSTTGAITGTPTAAATTNITIKAINSGGTGTATLVLNVNPANPVISSAATASGSTNHAFSYQITASNTPTSYTATNLPAGLSVNTSTGLISGTPTTVASTSVTLGATNAGGTGNKTLTLNVTLGIPVITSALTASGTTGVAFTYQISANPTPTSYAATGLPTGLSVNTATGLISGTSNTAATTSVTIKGVNASGTGTATLSLTIHVPTSVVTSSGTATGKVNAAFSYQVTATNTPTGFSASGLPAGLSINASTGLISGTPTVPGNYSVTVNITNAGGTTTSTLLISILPPLPYTADFETSEGYATGSLHNQLNWTVTPGTATVTTADHANGTQSVQLSASTPPALVTQNFAAETGQTIEFFDFYAKPVATSSFTSSNTFTIETATFGFLLNGTNGILSVLNGNGSGGGTWSQTSYSVPLGTGNQLSSWVRLTGRLNFTTHKWDLYANAQMVAADVPATTSTSYLSTFKALGDTATPSAFDYIYSGPTNPLFSDSNNNGIDDTWETNHGLSLSNNNRNLSPSGNGVTVVQAYVSGTNPNDFFNGATPTITILGGNNQITLAGQFNPLAFDVGVWNPAGTAPLVNAPVTFTVQSGGALLATTTTGSPTLTSSINLYTDTNGTAQIYFKQPSTAYIQSTVSFTAGTAQTSFNSLSTANGDTDGDQLPDAWEDQQLGTRSYGAGDDPGGVGRTLLQSYQQSLSPWAAPTVASGLRAWYRADAGILKDGSNKVSQWTDLSGHGFHVIQTTYPTRQPLWVNNVLNGHPALQFDSAISTSLATSGPIDLHSGQNNLTVIVVMSPAATQSTPAPTVLDMSFDANVADTGFGLQQEFNQLNRYKLMWRNGARDTVYGSQTVETVGGQVQVVSLLKNGTSAAGYLNGALQGTQTVAADMSVPLNQFILGCTPNFNGLYTGQIAEVLIYNRALSDTERQAVESALKTKYISADADADGLPDVWEDQQLGTRSYGAGDDPGGVGRTLLQSYQQSLSPWPAPTVSSGLRAWYRADAGVAKNGSNSVSQWTDLSGHGFHVAQTAVPTMQPVWMNNAANGHPTVQFNSFASNSLATRGPIDLHAGQTDLTVIVVMSPAAAHSWYFPTVLGMNTDLNRTDTGFGFQQEFGQLNRYQLSWRNSAEDNVYSAQPVDTVAGQIQVVSTIKNGTSGKAYRNGTLQGTTTVPADMSVLTNQLILGSGANGGAAYSGQIAEVLIYNRALSDTERQAVESALKTKYIGTDSDSDGLPDAWEDQQLGTRSYGAGDDPGGVGRTLLQSYQQSLSPWPAPTVSSGLRAWYRADTGIVKDGSNKVSQWTDLSGSGLHVVQTAAPAMQPLWVNNAANGHPALQFDSFAPTNLATIGPVDLHAGQSDLTVIVVMSPAAAHSTNVPTVLGMSTDLNLPDTGFGLQQDYYQLNHYQLAWRNSAKDNVYVGVPVATSSGQVQILSEIKDATTATGYLNGVLQGTTTVPADMSVLTNQLILGSGANGGVAYSGQISEVLIYNRALNASERQAVETALTTKYINTNPAADTDGNGIADAWEIQYFGHIGVDPNADPDGDGVNNLTEFLTGRNPTKGEIPGTTATVNLRVYLPNN